MNLPIIQNWNLNKENRVNNIEFHDDLTHEDYEVNRKGAVAIVDCTAAPVQEVTVNKNGNITISPPAGYNSMQGVDLNVAIPTETKTVTLNPGESGVISPSTGNLISQVCYTVSENEVICCPTYTANGNYSIGAVKCADVCVNLPIQSPVNVTIGKNCTCVINPTDGNIALSQVTICTDFDSTSTSCCFTENGCFTVLPPAGSSALDSVDVCVDVVPPEQTCISPEFCLTRNNHTICCSINQDCHVESICIRTCVPAVSCNMTVRNNGTYVLNSGSVGNLLSNVKFVVDIPGASTITPIEPVTKYNIYKSPNYQETNYCGLIFTPWDLGNLIDVDDTTAAQFMKHKELTAILCYYNGYYSEPNITNAAGNWCAECGAPSNMGCLQVFADYKCRYFDSDDNQILVFETNCMRDVSMPHDWTCDGGPGSGCEFKLSVAPTCCMGEWIQHDGGFNTVCHGEVCYNQNGNYRFECPGEYLDYVDICVETPEVKPEENFICTITENGCYCFIPEEGHVYSEGRICVTARRTEETADCCYTANGSYTITPTTGNVLSSASVCVAIPIESKTCNITTINSTTVDLTADEGTYLDNAIVNITIPKECGVGNYTANGTYKIIPSDGKLLECADITVNIPTEAITCNINQDGTYTITPSTGNYISSATIVVDTPDKKNEEAKSCCYTANGCYTIVPSADNKTLCKVDVEVAIPTEQTTKTYTTNGCYVITPTTGNYLDSVTVCVNTPVRKAEETKTCCYTANGCYTISPTSGKVLSSATVCVAIPTETKTCSWNTPGSWTITPSSGKLLSCVDVTFTVPTENKTCTYTQNGTYCILPTSGKYLTCAKVNVSIPTETKTCTYTANGSYTINPSTGKYLNKACVCVNIPVQSRTCTYTQAGNYTIKPDNSHCYLTCAVVCVDPDISVNLGAITSTSTDTETKVIDTNGCCVGTIPAGTAYSTIVWVSTGKEYLSFIGKNGSFMDCCASGHAVCVCASYYCGTTFEGNYLVCPVYSAAGGLNCVEFNGKRCRALGMTILCTII